MVESTTLPATAHPEISSSSKNELESSSMECEIDSTCTEVEVGKTAILKEYAENENQNDIHDVPFTGNNEFHSPFSKGKKFRSLNVFQKSENHSVHYPEDKGMPIIKYEDQHSEFTYKMDTPIRGNAVIINMKNFAPETGLDGSARHGTDKDTEKLVQMLLELGFLVNCYTNVTKSKIKSALKEASKNKMKLDCFACFLLSHGDDGIIYAYDGELEIKNLASIFEVPAWVGKPKLFFIQACQGTDFMDGILPLDQVDGVRRNTTINLPSQTDFLFAYSTTPGFYSWRNTTKGSWFIQALIGVFRKHAHELDVLQMLTRVNAMMSTRRSSTNDIETDNKRQIACIVSRLTKELFFFPPNGQLKE